MKCPACTKDLTEIDVEGTKVDVCKNGCGGVWFDRFELKEFDEKHEAKGELLNAITPDSNITVDHSKKRNCPRDQMPMMRHLFNPGIKVEVDHCPKCAGYWLDLGELAKIRTTIPTEEERKAFAQKAFSEMFDGDLKKMRSKSAEDAKEARKIAGMFKWILPSYWIPGDQDGGAY